MKIKDLIQDLSEYKDQDMEVCVFDRHHPDRIAFKIMNTAISNHAVLIEIETSTSDIENEQHITDLHHDMIFHRLSIDLSKGNRS